MNAWIACDSNTIITVIVVRCYFKIFFKSEKWLNEPPRNDSYLCLKWCGVTALLMVTLFYSAYLKSNMLPAVSFTCNLWLPSSAFNRTPRVE